MDIIYACTIILTGIFTSCKDSHKKIIPAHPYKNDLGIKPANLAQLDTVNYTTIKWINPVVNLGTLKEGDSTTIRYRFKNTGENPLFLSAVRPSCGCSVPHYSEEAIMPDEEGELTVNFNTAGQSGVIHKTITVTSNTANGVRHVLTINGLLETVKEPARQKP
jgi:Protein of unknown function (DUF1573)